MKTNASKTWRAMGEYAAFAPAVWEFHSELYCKAARQLREDYESHVKSSPRDTLACVACITVGQFNMCLALELICKARYLATDSRPRKEIYGHDVAKKLLPKNLLSDEQRKLLDFAVVNVEWAGRYPTPKWDTDTNKQKYDVPVVDEAGSWDPNNMPNIAGIGIIDDLVALYVYIQKEWTPASYGLRKDVLRPD